MRMGSLHLALAFLLGGLALALDPTGQPTRQPSFTPSRQPTRQPISYPSSQPTHRPTSQPSRQPVSWPTGQPSRRPTSQPTEQPSEQPSGQPSKQPLATPTAQPSRQPTGQPSRQPTCRPSGQPSRQPTTRPSGQPSRQPSSQPTISPTSQPSIPTGQPTQKPTAIKNALGDTAWPKFRDNKQDTGISDSAASSYVVVPYVLWSRLPPVINGTFSGFTSSPSIFNDSSFVIGSNDYNLYHYSSFGKFIWKFATNDSIVSSPAITNRGSIIFASTDGCVYAVSRQGRAEWSFQTNNQIKASPAIDGSGNIYIGSLDGNMYKLSPSGSSVIVFAAKRGIASSAAIDQNNNVYFGCDDGFIRKLGSTGSSKNPVWEFDAKSMVRSSPALVYFDGRTDDNLLVVGSLAGTLFALHADPKKTTKDQLKWSFPTSASIYSSPLVVHNDYNQGLILFGNDNCTFNALDFNGKLKWKAYVGGKVRSSATLNGPNEVIFASGDGILHSLDLSTGKEKWVIRITSSPLAFVGGSPSVDRDGSILIATDYIYKISNPSPTLQPTGQPSSRPSKQPSSRPSGQPSLTPTRQPTGQPSRQPTRQPSDQPSSQPSGQPSRQPTRQPLARPTRQPSSQPSRQPSSQPSSRPTHQPTAQPTMRPSMPTSQPTAGPSKNHTQEPSWQPTGSPTLQPVSIPSGRPTHQPTSQPTTQPSGQPSRQPSSQPTAQPTAQPSLQPTSQPSIIPTSQPSRQPTRQPTGKPSIQPSRQPTSQPSRQPSGQPTRTPTHRPSSQPSRRPTSQPSHQPSSTPTRQPVGSPTARPSFKPTETYCVAGSYVSSHQCLKCKTGKYSPQDHSKGCLTCPPGYGNDLDGSVSCTLCSIGSYSPGGGSCTQCVAGRITPAKGSTSIDNCLSPTPNFAVGGLTLGFSIFLAAFYIFRSRFYKTAFIRKHRFYLSQSDKFQKLSRFMEKTYIRYCIASEIRRERKKFDEPNLDLRKPWSWCDENFIEGLFRTLVRFFKTVLFIAFACSIAVGAAFASFIKYLIKALFKALIIWRQMHLLELIGITVSFPDILEAVVSELAGLFPPWMRSVIHYVFWPITRFYTLLASVKIDLTGINVTCSGAMAPIQLLLNMVTMGAVIIIVESDFQVFQSLSYQSIDAQFFKIILTREYREEQLKNKNRCQWLFYWPWYFVKLILFSLAFAVGQVLDFNTVLQFLVSSFVKVGPFFPTHDFSPSCDAMPAAPFIDSAFAYLSTIVAYLLIVPVIYEFSKFFAPIKPEETPNSGNANAKPGNTNTNASANAVAITNASDDTNTTAIANAESGGRRYTEHKAASRSSKTQGRHSESSFMQPPAVDKSKKGLRGKASNFFTLLRTSLTSFSPDLWFLFFSRHLESSISKLGPKPDVKGRPQPPDRSCTEKLWRLGEDVRSEEKEEWERHKKLAGLKSYFELIQEECFELWPELKKSNKPLLKMLAYIFLAVTCYGHVMTDKGRNAWRTVAMKYFSFLCVCVGYWGPVNSLDGKDGKVASAQLADVFGIEKKISKYSIEGARPKNVYDENVSKCLKNTIAPRTTILQAIPGGTYISAAIVETCECPLWVCDDNFHRSLFFKTTDIWKALRNEVHAKDYMHSDLKNQLWIEYMACFHLFCTTNRIIKTSLMFYKTIFSIVLVHCPESKILYFTFLYIVGFYSALDSLTYVVWLGKAMHIKDWFGFVHRKIIDETEIENDKDAKDANGEKDAKDANGEKDAKDANGEKDAKDANGEKATLEMYVTDKVKKKIWTRMEKKNTCSESCCYCDEKHRKDEKTIENCKKVGKYIYAQVLKQLRCDKVVHLSLGKTEHLARRTAASRKEDCETFEFAIDEATWRREKLQAEAINEGALTAIKSKHIGVGGVSLLEAIPTLNKDHTVTIELSHMEKNINMGAAGRILFTARINAPAPTASPPVTASSSSEKWTLTVTAIKFEKYCLHKKAGKNCEYATCCSQPADEETDDDDAAAADDDDDDDDEEEEEEKEEGRQMTTRGEKDEPFEPPAAQNSRPTYSRNCSPERDMQHPPQQEHQERSVDAISPPPPIQNSNSSAQFANLTSQPESRNSFGASSTHLRLSRSMSAVLPRLSAAGSRSPTTPHARPTIASMPPSAYSRPVSRKSASDDIYHQQQQQQHHQQQQQSQTQFDSRQSAELRYEDVHHDLQRDSIPYMRESLARQTPLHPLSSGLSAPQHEAYINPMMARPQVSPTPALSSPVPVDGVLAAPPRAAADHKAAPHTARTVRIIPRVSQPSPVAPVAPQMLPSPQPPTPTVTTPSWNLEVKPRSTSPVHARANPGGNPQPAARPVPRSSRPTVGPPPREEQPPTLTHDSRRDSIPIELQSPAAVHRMSRLLHAMPPPPHFPVQLAVSSPLHPPTSPQMQMQTQTQTEGGPVRSPSPKRVIVRPSNNPSAPVQPSTASQLHSSPHRLSLSQALAPYPYPSPVTAPPPPSPITAPQPAAPASVHNRLQLKPFARPQGKQGGRGGRGGAGAGSADRHHDAL